jgi:hypothetical protein
LRLVSALVLIIAPWIVGYPGTAKDAHRNELAVGIVVLFIALARFAKYPGKWEDLMVLLAGAWMVASPWALHLQKTAVIDGAQIVDVAIGIVLMVLSVPSLLLLMVTDRSERAGAPRETRQTADTASHRQR